MSRTQMIEMPSALDDDARDPLRRIADFHLASEADTGRLGEDLSLAFKPGDLIALIGDLGAGKSTLARAAIHSIAGQDDLDVPSPTFTLVQAYGGRHPVSHFDLYRLSDPSELTELGLGEALETGIALVEWPENGGDLASSASIVVELAVSETGGRRVAIAARGEAVDRVSRTLALRDFLVGADLAETKRRFLLGDASSRRYETVGEDNAPLLLMDAPRKADGPPIRDGLPYSQLVHLAEDVAPFVAIAGALGRAGFTVPSILKADLDAGILLTSHLGTQTILKADGSPDPERYKASVECLARLHGQSWDDELPVPGHAPHRVPRFDDRSMTIEAELLIDWYVPHLRGAPLGDDERERFTETWAAILAEIDGAETTLVLRDYHSPNILWQGGAIGPARIGIIDFQDAMIGPTAYDVASLAQDARVDVAPELEAALVAAYVKARREADESFKPFAFERDYAVMAAQRASKILGIFVRLAVRDGKPQYRRHIPRIRGYLQQTLNHPTLSALKLLYADLGVTEPR